MVIEGSFLQCFFEQTQVYNEVTELVKFAIMKLVNSLLIFDFLLGVSYDRTVISECTIGNKKFGIGTITLRHFRGL